MKSLFAVLIALGATNALALCKDADIAQCPDFTLVRTACDEGIGTTVSAEFGPERSVSVKLEAQGNGEYKGFNDKNQPFYVKSTFEKGDMTYTTTTLIGRDLTPSETCAKLELKPRASAALPPATGSSR